MMRSSLRHRCQKIHRHPAIDVAGDVHPAAHVLALTFGLAPSTGNRSGRDGEQTGRSAPTSSKMSSTDGSLGAGTAVPVDPARTRPHD